MSVPAHYFDGVTSRRHQVTLTVEAGIATLSGEVQRSTPLHELRVSEPMGKAARKVTFPDGAYLEVLDNNAFAALLSATGHGEPLVARMQQSWPPSLLALAATIAILVLGYLYGLPAASTVVANAMPPKTDRLIGREALRFFDAHLLAPSVLSSDRQRALAARFAAMAPARPNAPPYVLVFRKSKIGPNAFALPSGHIVLTDEIVNLINDDEAVMGVLAHELGHLHERHMMRRLIQNSAVAAVTTALFGDVSSVLANVPTVMLDMKYSRDAERAADDYAAAMLRANGIPLSKLAMVFDKLGRVAAEPSSYLSSHPVTSERLERLQLVKP